MQRVLLEPAGADPTRQVELVGWGIQAASGLESTMANRVLGQVLGACEAGSIQNMACKAPLNFKHAVLANQQRGGGTQNPCTTTQFNNTVHFASLG